MTARISTDGLPGVAEGVWWYWPGLDPRSLIARHQTYQEEFRLAAAAASPEVETLFSAALRELGQERISPLGILEALRLKSKSLRHDATSVFAIGLCAIRLSNPTLEFGAKRRSQQAVELTDTETREQHEIVASAALRLEGLCSNLRAYDLWRWLAVQHRVQNVSLPPRWGRVRALVATLPTASFESDFVLKRIVSECLSPRFSVSETSKSEWQLEYDLAVTRALVLWYAGNCSDAQAFARVAATVEQKEDLPPTAMLLAAAIALELGKTSEARLAIADASKMMLQDWPIHRCLNDMVVAWLTALSGNAEEARSALVRSRDLVGALHLPALMGVWHLANARVERTAANTEKMIAAEHAALQHLAEFPHYGLWKLLKRNGLNR